MRDAVAFEVVVDEVDRFVFAKLLLRNNLAIGIICLFRFHGWGDGHGRPRAQANPPLSVPRMSVTQ
jgi:hypothetical protein